MKFSSSTCVNGAYIKIKTSPLPHVFGLRRLRGNPPRSLWLQHIHWMCCLTRRAHTAVPPLHTLREPTASAPRGATLGTHIEKYRPLVISLVHGRKKPHSPVHLYYPSSSALATVAALRLRVRSKFSKKSKFIKKIVVF